MSRKLGGQLRRKFGIEPRRGDAMHDQLPDVAAHELFLGRVEITVDIAEGGQIKDDRPLLLLCLGPVRAELEHPDRIPRFVRAGMSFAVRVFQRRRGPALVWAYVVVPLRRCAAARRFTSSNVGRPASRARSRWRGRAPSYP